MQCDVMRCDVMDDAMRLIGGSKREPRCCGIAVLLSMREQKGATLQRNWCFAMDENFSIALLTPRVSLSMR